MFNKDKDTITYTYNMSFICSVWLICFNTSSYDICTAVAPGTVGTVPTVPLFLAGTANRTTIWTENNNFEMKKGYSLLMWLQ